MVTSFFQVGLECISRLNSGDHAIIELGLPAIIIMASTVVIKALCFLWCRLIKNSSVQALAQDAMTDIVFNIFSIIFPLGKFSKSPCHPGQSTNLTPVGFYAQLWWLDAVGGLLLSMFVIFNWAQTSAGHIRNLTGAEFASVSHYAIRQDYIKNSGVASCTFFPAFFFSFFSKRAVS
jgi:divalent metal cation (Fe/Co/Zn/Cd) transporter